MAKKKQLAGKTTKLAKLPLTQALAGQTEEPGASGMGAGASVETRQLPLTPGRSPEDAQGPLAALYLALCQELTTLKSQLAPEAEREPGLPPPAVAVKATVSPRIRQTLRQAREDLRDLHQLLSN
jgi:hypothetical protein